MHVLAHTHISLYIPIDQYLSLFIYIYQYLSLFIYIYTTTYQCVEHRLERRRDELTLYKTSSVCCIQPHQLGEDSEGGRDSARGTEAHRLTPDVYLSAYIYLSIYLCIYLYIYVCIYICIYNYTPAGATRSYRANSPRAARAPQGVN